MNTIKNSRQGTVDFMFYNMITAPIYHRRISATFVTARLFNYWAEQHQLLDKRINKEGWRLLSFVDLVWLKIIHKQSCFGTNIPLLKKFKKKIFDDKTSGLIQLIRKIFFTNTHGSLLVNMDGGFLLMDDIKNFNKQVAEVLAAGTEPGLIFHINLRTIIESYIREGNIDHRLAKLYKKKHPNYQNQNVTK